jgi:hypothetical protein
MAKSMVYLTPLIPKEAYSTQQYRSKEVSMSAREDRRNKPRFRIPLTVWTDEGSGWQESLVDMSNSGCSIRTPTRFDRKEHVLLHFEAPRDIASTHSAFCLHGCIIWSSPETPSMYRYGIEFPETTSSFLNEQLVRADSVLRDMERKGVASKVT